MMQSPKSLPTYNLGAIIRETGVKADTLRAWERRYNLPQPTRSEGRQRLYSQRDLETIKWLIARQKEGLRISQAAKMWRNQIADGLDPLEEQATAEPSTGFVSLEGSNIDEFKAHWLDACIAFDEARAEQVIAEAFSQYPPEIVCFDVLFAGLSEIGEGWYRGEVSVQQEHFASVLVARRLNTLIAGAPPPTRSERIVIAAPSEEDHYLSSLLIAFLLRRRGWDVIYLGADVPTENFRATVKELKPILVVLTAHLITTAASLLNMANDLNGLQTKLAFGGLIFNRIPPLRKRIPGFFLGDDLKKVVPNIEQYILSSSEEKFTPLPAPSPLLEPFLSALPSIENHINDKLADQPQLRSISNKYFNNDIIAALELGDVSLLSIDMDWLHVFLSNFDIPEQVLLNFLQTYYQVVEQVMGDSATEILEWLQGEKDRLVA